MPEPPGAGVHGNGDPARVESKGLGQIGLHDLIHGAHLDEVISNGYSFQVELNHLAWRIGCKIVEVPIVFEERHSGSSKMSKKIIFEALWMVWKLLYRAKFKRAHKCPVPENTLGFRCCQGFQTEPPTAQ